MPAVCLTELTELLTRAFVLEWLAALLTIWGAWLLASKRPGAARGWLLFLAANGLWIAFALDAGLRGLLVQQLVLTCISLKGIWTGLVKPWLDRAADELIDNVKGGKP